MATIAAVRAEIQERMHKRTRELGRAEGRQLIEADFQHMISAVGSDKHWGELQKEELHLRQICDPAVAGAMLEALRALQSPHFATLSRLAANPAVVQLAEELRAFEATDSTWSKRSPRAIVADPLRFKGARFWWTAEGPKPRDLALLSLLAGNFPDATEGCTVAEVIQKESDAIGAQLRRRRTGRRD